MVQSVLVNDKMQSGYTYLLVEPTGKNFASEFKPDLTPQRMLELGVFGGKYMTDCRAEFPEQWFLHAKLSPDSTEATLNYFEILASQPLKEWQRKGWIKPDDPRGWFQWYCRYYLGRRIPGYDSWQIGRWKAMTRHRAQLRKNCQPGDITCRRKQRQALLQWAYDARKI